MSAAVRMADRRGEKAVPVEPLSFATEDSIRPHNEKSDDVTSHAEIVSIRGELGLGNVNLSGIRFTSRSNRSPCARGHSCSRAFACLCSDFDPRAGAFGSLYDIPEDGRLNHGVL